MASSTYTTACRKHEEWPGKTMSQGPHAQLERDERELIARVVAGENEAFYELVRPYERAIFFAARGVTDNDVSRSFPCDDFVVSPRFTAWPAFWTPPRSDAFSIKPRTPSQPLR